MRRLTELTAAAWRQAGAEVTVATAPDTFTRHLHRAGSGTGTGAAARAMARVVAAETAAWATGTLRRADGEIDLVHVMDARDVVHTTVVRGRIPVAVTCHDIGDLVGPEPADRDSVDRGHPGGRRARAAVRALAGADRVLATSRYAAERLEGALGRRPCVLYPPLAPALTARPSGVAAPAAPQWPYLLTVSGREPDARRTAAISAWIRLRRTPSLDGASLIIVGDPLTTREEALVTECGGYASVIESVGDAQLAALYRHSRAVLALGRPRGFEWSIAHAHHADRPVLATDHPVFEETGGAGCVYLPVEGMERFDATTWNCVAEDLTAALVADRAGVNADRFGWQRFVDQLPDKAFGRSIVPPTALSRPAVRVPSPSTPPKASTPSAADVRPAVGASR